MLIALAGVTGVGKSFYSQEIENNFKIKKIHTIRTRQMRAGEINGVTGYFMTEDELDNENVKGNIAIDFSEFGGRYVFLKCIILILMVGRRLNLIWFQFIYYLLILKMLLKILSREICLKIKKMRELKKFMNSIIIL